MLTPLPKTITLSLDEYLDLAWSYREHAVVDINRAAEIKALDPNENLCHVELPSDPIDLHPLGPQTKAKIWRKKEWEISIQKWREIKAASELHNKQVFAYKDKLLELTRAIRKAMGGSICPENVAHQFALTILKSNNAALAKMYGVENLLDEWTDKTTGKLLFHIPEEI